MVWARTKLLIEDDLIKPRNRMEVKFSGINPEKFYHEIPKLIASVFRIDERFIQEKKFSWTHGEPQKFKIAWDVNKELDLNSYYTFIIDLEGMSSKGVGNATIIIEAYLRTEYPQDTFWHRSLAYEMFRMFWHKAFYVSKRDKYMEEGRRLIGIFLSDVKALARG